MLNKNSDNMIFVGTYTKGSSEGIYSVNLDERTGQLEVAGLAAELENPTYLTLSRDGRYLYAVLETESFMGNAGGAVAAFAAGGCAGTLELLNIQSTIGRGPCHLSTDIHNHYLFTANYTEGSVTAFSLECDGRIGSVLSHIHHQGNGPNRERQEGPHAHCVVLTPDGKALCAVDLGIDQLVIYDLDSPDGTINSARSRLTGIKPGSGARHLVFHPEGKHAYLINELSSDIVIFCYSVNAGSFIPVQYISALPENFVSESYGAAVHVSPNSKFLYASNRGHDSIAIFHIHPDSGMLKICGHQSTFGSYPRDFAIHPAGNFLVAANQYSGTLVSFHVDNDTGLLEPTGSIVSLEDAVCLKFGSPG